MKIAEFIELLRTTPQSVEFETTMDLIKQHYDYTPTAFDNGDAHSEAGQNEGSCRILAFGMLNQLSEQELLHCFGRYYRVDVLENPDGNDHANIRNFMQSGWAGVSFDHMPLKAR